MATRNASRCACRIVLALTTVVFSAQHALAQATAVSPRAIELFKNRQYNDAAKVLTVEIAGKDEASCGKHFLLLGECQFLSKQYDASRINFAKAKKHCTDEGDRISAEFRLACVAFRENSPTAIATLDAFVGDHPTDPRNGRLLVYRMMLVSAKGKAAEADMEAMHTRIYENLRRFGADIGGDADEVLSEYYKKTGNPEKAEGLYTRVAMSLARQINEKKRDKETVPASMEKAHDNAALQLGIIHLEKKNRNEAVKWLESVRYDVEMRVKARLFLAKLAYEAGDFAGVTRYVGDREFLDTLPAGALRSDVYLVLGLAEKTNPAGNAAKVETYLREVGPEARGYAQAQLTIGDMYREKGLVDPAIKAYRAAMGKPEYAAQALFHIGSLHMDLAAKDSVKAKQYYGVAAEAFRELALKHPASPLIKQVKEKAPILAAAGINVEFALADEENVKQWDKVVKEKPGTADAASALVNLMRQHVKRVGDEKKLIKAPDYVLAAAAADKLLDSAAFAGAGLAAENFRVIQAEAAFIRGKCELASLGTHAPGTGRFLAGASADKAVALLSQAQKGLAGGKADLARAVELTLLEAQFKSDKPENREAALRALADAAERLGSDPQFKRLGMDIADWSEQQGLLPESAKQYALVAEHAGDLPAEDQMKLWSKVGSLWSRAGREAMTKQNQSTFTIHVYPKETIQLGDSFLKTSKQLQRAVTVKWPKGGNVTAREAIETVSKATGIPFVWSKETGKHTLNQYLDEKRVALKDGPTTPAAVLGAVLDGQLHRVALDVGLADGTPTTAAGVDPEDPDGGRYKPIEIYDARLANNRFKPLAARFGEVDFGRGGNPKRGGGGGGMMLYTVLERVEQTTNTRITWAEGIDKQDKLAKEIRRIDGIHSASSCGEVLAAALDQHGLRYRLEKVELAPQYFDNAKDAFNKVRKFDPKSSFGEKALIAVAQNYQMIKDYDKMKIILREYLKVFDSTSSAFYQQACYLVGWSFENERNYREATGYYSRAAEERLVFTKRPDDKPVDRAALRALLSNDSQVALFEPVTAELKEAGVDQLAEFARTKGHVLVRVDETAQIATGKFSSGPATKRPVFDVLCDGLDAAGITFKVENLSPEVAERALYRMAYVYQHEGSGLQAIEACNLLLSRYPGTPRRRDATILLIDIYKKLNQYGKAIATLGELRKSATDAEEGRRLDIEMATMYYDMAAFGKAADSFRALMASSKDPEQARAARSLMARCLFREGKLDEAQAAFAGVAKEETDAYRQLVAKLMAFTIDVLRGKATEREYPVDAHKWITEWESRDDAARNRLPATDWAKATWIYYTMGLMDQHAGRYDEAIRKFNGAVMSVDEFVAGDAAFQKAVARLKNRETGKAIEELDFALRDARSSETTVRSLYLLAQTLEATGKHEAARQRYEQIVERYPLSPYVAEIRKRPGATTAESQPR